MLWKKIKNIKLKNVDECIKKLKKQSYVSPWIIDIFNKRKKISYKKYENLEIHRVSVKNLGFNKPTSLKKIYEILKKKRLSSN